MKTACEGLINGTYWVCSKVDPQAIFNAHPTNTDFLRIDFTNNDYTTNIFDLAQVPTNCFDSTMDFAPNTSSNTWTAMSNVVLQLVWEAKGTTLAGSEGVYGQDDGSAVNFASAKTSAAEAFATNETYETTEILCYSDLAYIIGTGDHLAYLENMRFKASVTNASLNYSFVADSYLFPNTNFAFYAWRLDTVVFDDNGHFSGGLKPQKIATQSGASVGNTFTASEYFGGGIL